MIEIWAVIGKSMLENDEEGIVTAHLPDGQLLPLVCIKQKNTVLLREVAKRSISHKDMQLVRFTAAETLEKI